jgi:ribonuclease BN (tRNA processing enzyme)
MGADAVRVTILGSGDAYGSGGRLHSAYLIEAPGTTFLLDAGPTVLQGLKRIGRDSATIDYVVLSHLHGDHFGGVPFLLLEYRYERPRTRPFTVYGPRDTFPLRFEELTPRTPRTIGGVRFLPFPVPHVSELLCFGLRIEVAGRTIVYSGDSAWTEDFVAQSRGADLFICECSTYETRLDLHIAYPELAARAKDLGCRRLLLSHLGSEVLHHAAELSLECATDGMTIEL